MRCLVVGDVAELGYPKSDATDKSYNFHKYVTSIDEFAGSAYYDTILVDGRFRAGAVKALGHMRRDSLLLVHGYTNSSESRGKEDARGYGTVIEKYFKMVARKETFAVFTPKEDVAAGASEAYWMLPEAA